MNSKHGMGLLAAAGVAVGVVGITMGGASGAPSVACTAADSGAIPVSAATGTTPNGAGNVIGVGPVGPVGPTGPSGADGADVATDGSGNGILVLPGLSVPGVDQPDPTGLPLPVAPTVPTVPTVSTVSGLLPLPSLSTDGSGGGSSGTEQPFVDVQADTTSVDAGDGAVQAPPTAGQVVIGSDELSQLLTVDGDLNLGG
jgi:hypothetical protein